MEWSLYKNNVKEIPREIATRNNPEFPFLKYDYPRSEVEKIPPIKSLPAASDAREGSAFEPEY
jgi:hypothetical protein